MLVSCANITALTLAVPQYYTPARAASEDMVAFHSSDYVEFLSTVTPDNAVRPLNHKV
jgi:acetoin utilization deacetylase AcuC-like enzyme